jgi:hypothetical protein
MISSTSSGAPRPGEGRGDRLEAGDPFEQRRPLLLAGLAVGDVDHDAPQPDHTPAVVAVCVAPPFEPAHLPVGAYEPVLDPVLATVGRDPRHLVENLGPVVGVDQRGPLVEGGRRAGVDAVEPFEVVVTQDLPGGQVEVEGAHAAGGHRRGQLLPTAGQGFVRLAAFGQVDAAADEPTEAAIGVGQRDGAGQDPAPGAIRPTEAIFELERLVSRRGLPRGGVAAVEIVGMDVVGPPVPQLVVEAPAGELEPPLVDEGAVAAPVGDPDKHGYRVGHGPERGLQIALAHHPRLPTPAATQPPAGVSTTPSISVAAGIGLSAAQLERFRLQSSMGRPRRRLVSERRRLSASRSSLAP